MRGILATLLTVFVYYVAAVRGYSGHSSIQRKNGWSDSAQHQLEIHMPGVTPRKEDMYLCTSVKLADYEQYVVQYEAMASGNTAHHMLLFGCDAPYSNEAFWLCGGTCKGSSKIMFAWAKNAPPTRLPKDVGFHIGGDSGVKHLVLQIHYKDAFPADASPDKSGLRMQITRQKQKFIAGIYLMMAYNLQIKPHSLKTHADVSCRYRGKTDLYPFAYRVHAHLLGEVITGYQYNDSWHLLGKGNPQWPQAFYPMEKTFRIKPGDYMFTRCTYNAKDSSKTTYIGSTHHDEMCNFYMMYYTDSSRGSAYGDCGGNNYPDLMKKLPAGSDTPLPPNPLLEETAKGKATSGLGLEVTENWPQDSITLGQISGVSTDTNSNVHIFHRGSRRWDGNSFDVKNKFNQIKDGPIKEKTLVTFSREGKIINQWGDNMFYLPHGLTIDGSGNTWVTDVGMHQVFKFKNGSTTPEFTLGEKFVPGNDKSHFCKPAAVAVLTSGEFYVADGYCNHRVVKFSKDGKYLMEWGTRTTSTGSDGFPPPAAFDIPHSISVAEDKQRLYVADRENSRIQVFDLTGKFITQFHPVQFGRMFAVTYNTKNGFLYAVNGPGVGGKKVQGFTLHPVTGKVLEMWSPHNKGFSNPHDVAVSTDGKCIFVGEIGPNKLWRFHVKLPDLPITQLTLHHPETVDKETQKKNTMTDDAAEFTASLVIGGLLIVPVVIVIVIALFFRLRKSGGNKKKSYAYTILQQKQDLEDQES